MSDDDALAAAILALLAARGPAKSICPSEAARAVAGSDQPEAWRRLMPATRRAAAALAKAGRIEIARKGRVVDPDAVKGVVRLRLPRSEPAPSPGLSPPPEPA